MEYQYILSQTKESVGIITLNRPKALNAVCEQMLQELNQQIKIFTQDESISVIIIRGSDKSFAAGIDIGELEKKVETFGIDALDQTYEYFKSITNCPKPIIAAVAGYALGIGCELALSCDIILVADNARFGQPEISLGVIPGFGATQRLCKILGKSKTMEMILTGRALNAEEAVNYGIASRIVALPDLFYEAEKIALRISGLPKQAVILAKDAINQSFNLSLNEGIAYENKSCKLCLGAKSFSQYLHNFIENRKK